MKDRRKFCRFDLNLPTEIVVIGAGQEAEVSNLLTSDICAGGAFFETEQLLPEGTQVRVGLILPIDRVKKLTGTHAYVKLTGTVKRCGASGMAVSFDEDYQMTPYEGAEGTSLVEVP